MGKTMRYLIKILVLIVPILHGCTNSQYTTHSTKQIQTSTQKSSDQKQELQGSLSPLIPASPSSTIKPSEHLLYIPNLSSLPDRPFSQRESDGFARLHHMENYLNALIEEGGTEAQIMSCRRMLDELKAELSGDESKETSNDLKWTGNRTFVSELSRVEQKVASNWEQNSEANEITETDKSYLDKLSVILVNIGELSMSVSALTLQKNNSDLWTQEDYLALDKKMAKMKSLYDEVEKLQAPEKFKEIHSLCLNASKKSLDALRLLKIGVSMRDANKILEAAILMYDGSIMFEQVKKEGEKALESKENKSDLSNRTEFIDNDTRYIDMIKTVLKRYGITNVDAQIGNGRDKGGVKCIILSYNSTSTTIDELGTETGNILGAYVGAAKEGWDIDELSVIVGDINGEAVGAWYCAKSWTKDFINEKISMTELMDKVLKSMRNF